MTHRLFKMKCRNTYMRTPLYYKTKDIMTYSRSYVMWPNPLIRTTNSISFANAKLVSVFCLHCVKVFQWGKMNLVLSVIL